MKIYIVVLKSNVHADKFDNIYGSYSSYSDAFSIMDELQDQGLYPEMFVSKLEVKA